MASDKSYPFPMWSPKLKLNDNPRAGELNPVYPSTKKQEDAFRSDGFTDTFANIEQHAFPRATYDKDGNMKPATSEAHLKELAASGFTLKPVAKKQAPTPRHALDKGHVVLNSEGAPHDGKLDELEDRISGLETDIADLAIATEANKTALDQILEAVTGGKAGKDKKDKAS